MGARSACPRPLRSPPRSHRKRSPPSRGCDS
jgi:hypothetical protein